MISVVLLAGDVPGPAEEVRVAVARSFGWLVSAVVAGVVGDVVAAAAPRLDLSDLADQVGCDLVQAATEADRFRDGVARARRAHILVVLAGYQPRGPLIDELDARHRSSVPVALVMSPRTLYQRLRPSRAPIVGVLATRDLCRREASFAGLARACKRRDRFASDADALA